MSDKEVPDEIEELIEQELSQYEDKLRGSDSETRIQFLAKIVEYTQMLEPAVREVTCQKIGELAGRICSPREMKWVQRKIDEMLRLRVN